MQQSKTQRHNNKQTWRWRSITGELCNSIREQVQIRTKTVESSERHEKQDKSVDFGQVAGKFGADININSPLRRYFSFNKFSSSVLIVPS